MRMTAQRQEHAPEPQRSEWLQTEREKREHAIDPEMKDTLAKAWARGEARKYIGTPLTGFGAL